MFPAAFRAQQSWALWERSCQAGSGGAAHTLQLTHQCFPFLIKCTAGKLMLKPLGVGLSN